MSHHPLEDAADEIYKLKQSRKGYFGNLTKLINRTSLLLTIPGNHDEVSYLIEKIEFALFKINKITNEYCQLVGDTEKANAKLIANEKEEHVNAILLECKTYLETVDVVSQVKSNLSGIQRLFKEDAPPHKDKESLRKQNNADRLSIKSRDTLSSRHSLPNNSLEAKLRAEQTRATAQRKLALSRKRQELTEAEIMLEVEEANGEFKIAKMLEVLDLENKNDIQNLQKMSSEKLSFNPRNTFKKADLTVPQTNINGRQSTSYLNARAQTFTPKRPDTQKLISTPTYNRKVIRNHTPFKASVHTDKNSNETNINEENGVDDFIDYLVEGQETVLEIDNDVNPTTLLQWEFESRHLPPIDLIKFNGDPTKWPEFIQSFKTRVHMKRSFSDSTRMERLISVLEGEAKQCVSSVGTDGIFYAGALKSLKTQFGNPYVVSYFKLKNLFDLPPLLHNDHQGLRCYYQQLKGTLTWLQSMGYDAVLRSIDNVTKAIMRLPKQLRSKFYIDMKETCYDETTINLLVFEKWLGKKINETFNPLASIIENEVKIKYPKYANGRQNMFALSSSSKDESNRVLKCWLCSKDHKVSDCDFLKNSPVNLRIDIVKEKRLCFNCLSNNHLISNCKSTNTCKINNCGKRHHTLLHRTNENEEEDTAVKEETEGTTNNHNSHRVKGFTYLELVPVILKNGEVTVQTNALLDSGSDITLIHQDIVDKLQLKTTVNENLNISNAFNHSKSINTNIVNFDIESITKDYSQKITAYTTKRLNLPKNKLDISNLKKQYPHLRNITFPLFENKDVSILIGTDHADILVYRDYRVGKKDEPVAVKTKFGWSLMGNVKTDLRDKVHCNFITENPVETISNTRKRFWEIELYGTLPKLHQLSLTPDEQKSLQILENTTSFKNGHFETGLLWKEDHPNLPFNRDFAIKRFYSLENKFEKNLDFAEKYKTQIKEYIALGFAEKLEPKQPSTITPITNYIPHHGVTNINKPGKIRVVFDASARYKNTSLNENLLPGIDFLNNLVSILLRFREGKYAVMADIQGMFHQINVRNRDVDAMRFVWRENPSELLRDYRMLVHIFGKVDSPSCANWALRKSVSDSESDIKDCIENNFYMDDFLKSLSNEDTLIQLALRLTTVLSTSGFRLTKFVSNSTNILQKLPTSEISPKIKNLDLNEQPLERALGMTWNIQNDTFTFKKIQKCYPDTKRGILSFTASIFDPLGILSPCILEPKLIIQQLWERNVGWDEDIPADLLHRWGRWKYNYEDVTQFNMPRWYGIHKSDNTERDLAIFCDASSSAYGCVAYLKYTNQENEKSTCRFITSKSCLAPLKERSMTIPRLELMAAVLGVRIKILIINELKNYISNVKFYTDSQIVLYYLKNESKKQPIFITNRLNEIRLNSNIHDWKFVPGDKNPADLCTRPTDVKKFINSRFWINGPEFLHTDHSFTPEVIQHMESECELKMNILENRFKACFEWERFSSFYRSVRTVAWVFRIKEVWRNKKKQLDKGNNLSLEDINNAKTEIIKHAQRECYPQEYQDLKNDKHVNIRSNLLPLQPFLSDDLIRIGGRLCNSYLPFQSKHQVIIDKQHPLATLLITHFHEKNLHCGRELTLNLLREQFWIPNSKHLIRKTIKNCKLCRLMTIQPKAPLMSNLPSERLSFEEPPFSCTGTDYFGPLLVKLRKGTRNSSAVGKRYGVIFTCLTTRACHIDLAGDLSTDSFILALRRFTARRGKPRLIRSDNGKNFVGAERELKEALNQLDKIRISEHLLKDGIEWKFNPPLAPWMGGAIESMVKLTKKSLKFIVKDRQLTEESLITLLTEIESIINSRPLTHLSDDPNDLEALTPNHILLGRQFTNPDICVVDDRVTNIRAKWKAVQTFASLFWKRFISEYVPSLTNRKKWNKHERNLQVGDLVLTADKNVVRAKWPLARVVEIIPGDDGVVRTVKIKTNNGIYIRAVQNLCLLEQNN